MLEAARMVIGWREWVGLPELGLPAIKAKVDTGAKTSALHAFDVEAFELGGQLFVQFRIHPLRSRKHVVTCRALVVDHRVVSDSNGNREKRYVILTTLKIGSIGLPIEMTLANRETMSHRMLLGRSAMRQFMIDPAHTFLLGKPANVSRHYKKPKKKRSRKKSGRRK